MSSPTRRASDCRKFSPNIFNKSKCSHCFRQREEHSAAALECNRASRKVTNCGYLFVAPDWDFSNPLYRTKRWQRRWFVLYDDGELTYSVDEHPETVPQAIVDMTKVLDVTSAENVTGHANSIAITAPDRVTFVKGTCPEESKWWLNILSAFPKSKGRHKRNATYPGMGGQTGQQNAAAAAVSLLHATQSTDAISVGVGGVGVGGDLARNRHSSYHKDALTSAQSAASVLIASNNAADDKAVSNWHHEVTSGSTAGNSGAGTTKTTTTTRTLLAANDVDDDEQDDGVETGEDVEDDDDDEERKSKNSSIVTIMAGNAGTAAAHQQDENNRNAGNELTTTNNSNNNHSNNTTNTNNGSNKAPKSCHLIEDERTIKDLTNQNWSTATTIRDPYHHVRQQHASRDETDFRSSKNNNNNSNNNNNNLRPKSLPLAMNSSTPAIVSAAIVKKIPPVMVTSSSSSTTTTAMTTADVNKSNNNNTNNDNGGNKCNSSPRLQLQLKHLQQRHENNPAAQQQQQQQQQQKHYEHERGDPDGGCNLDDLSSSYLAKTAELRVNAAAVAAATTAGAANATALATGNATNPALKSLHHHHHHGHHLPAEESLNAKKGWLMKQDNRTGDWTKHWFTLSGAALFYYRDPVSEERGVLDGVLDVNSLTSVVEINANTKNYAFQLSAWDKQRITLASLSPNSRNSWIAVLRNAAGLKQQQPPQSQQQQQQQQEQTAQAKSRSQEQSTSAIVADMVNLKSEIEKDFIKAQLEQQQQQKQKTIASSAAAPATQTCAAKTALSPTTPTTPKSGPTQLSSEDEEYRTASEGGRRDSIDWGSPLSPSPPIPPPMLRAKDRLRVRTTSNCPRLHKRSRSSPPSSRRSTIDSVGSDELAALIMPVQEELCIDKELAQRLSVAEKECVTLREQAKRQESRLAELLNTLERTEQQLNLRIQEMESERLEQTIELANAKQNAAEIIDRLSNELALSQLKVKELEDRLTRGIEENETLYKRLRELEGGTTSNLNRAKIKRLDSLSDLTTITDIDPNTMERDTLAEEYRDLRTRFEKAIREIRAMKRELKESQNEFDTLEISHIRLKQEIECKDVEDRAQLQMMAARIQDLTQKYSSSELQLRTLKQRLGKSDRRRSLSLKSRELSAGTVPKELESKVVQLEHKIDGIEKQNGGNEPKPTYRSVVRRSARRRSLENSAVTDSLSFMVRLSQLEKRCEQLGGGKGDAGGSSPMKISEHLADRLRCFENVLSTSKERLEQSLLQLQNLRTSRSRRSVSPITDRKDSYRYVERTLSDIVKLLRESCDICVVGGAANATETADLMLISETNPVKVALSQLETQLRNKLCDLLKQRRMLRERNELTKHKDLELLAERVAYESICFARLRDSVARAENPELFGEQQTRAEIAETSHLMTLLKAKLSGKPSALKPSGGLDLLAGVLARRLLLSACHKEGASRTAAGTTMGSGIVPVEQCALENLLRQQHEINVIAKRYKNHTMEQLATGLAAETLSYLAANDMVQGTVQEAWRQAQEAVNAELVQAEIAHIMERNAARLGQTTAPAYGYTLTAEERLSFEKFTDAVHDTLRKEMEQAGAQLTACYEAALQKLKRREWRLQLEQEQKHSEGRQLLAEFADIVAHKALIDARIAVLRGEYQATSAAIEQTAERAPTSDGGGVVALQRYEQLFEELSTDLQLNNPEEMLVQADFEFIYKQQTLEFINDREVLADISNFLGQLEDSLIALQCEAKSTGGDDSATPTSIPRSAIEIECLQDVCRKCCELRQRADQLLQVVHCKLTSPCVHCLQLQEKLRGLENEAVEQQQLHAKELNTLMQRIKQTESERDALNSDLNRSEELIEQRERELNVLTQKLQAKEQEQQQKQRQIELLQKCERDLELMRIKCAQQDEQYAEVLQERTGLETQLAKEQERCRLLDKRLELLEREHSKQLECLQEAYHADYSIVNANDESFRQRYQTEIEHLRTLCQKGLTAMETSHRRTISELEEKHRHEIDRLLKDKETALAEETQATLAALDVMRKAHQSEVQREVARFKQEFLRQVQQGEHTLAAAKMKEVELEELRQEILSFSEKYSTKCIENAALEEKLRATNQKLRHFQQLQQLELRNKQFRAHLASEDLTGDANFVQGLTSPRDELTCLDSEV